MEHAFEFAKIIAIVAIMITPIWIPFALYAGKVFDRQEKEMEHYRSLKK